MKILASLTAAAGLIALAGCYEPPFSYDVRGNGQGGVVITEVPHRTVPGPPAPPPMIVYIHDAPVTAPATAPAPAPAPEPPPAPIVQAPPPTPPPATQTDEQQHIADLEARVKELAAENARLKQQVPAPATMPATTP
jgi:hypothetical protein